MRERKRTLAAGPRSWRDLAQVIGTTPPTMHEHRRKAREIDLLGPWPSVEALAEALAMDVERLVGVLDEMG